MFTLVTILFHAQIARIPLVPPIVGFMLNHPMVEDYDLSSLSIGVVSASSLEKNVTNMFKEKFPNILLTQGILMDVSIS